MTLDDIPTSPPNDLPDSNLGEIPDLPLNNAIDAPASQSAVSSLHQRISSLNTRSKLFLPGVGVLLLLFGLGVTMNATKTTQDIRNRATGSTQATLTLSPGSQAVTI